jgi:hypothetical protein
MSGSSPRVAPDPAHRPAAMTATTLLARITDTATTDDQPR